MLVKSGAKLLDFGLAKPVATPASAALITVATVSKAVTAEGTIVGTFQYMAPEQVEGKAADARLGSSLSWPVSEVPDAAHDPKGR